MNSIHALLEPMVKRVVDTVHSSFPEHHSREDTESVLWVWVYEKKSTVESLLNSGSWEGALYHMMTGVANTHLRGEDAASYGYSQEDVFHYTTDAIKALLENVFDYEDWQSFAMRSDGQPRTRSQANMTGDVVAMLADVKSAVEKLNDEQYNALIWYYKLHFTYEDLGEQFEVSPDAARKRVERAVQAVRRRLGKKPFSVLREGYSGRSGRLGTAEANATVERQYEG